MSVNESVNNCCNLWICIELTQQSSVVLVGGGLCLTNQRSPGSRAHNHVRNEEGLSDKEKRSTKYQVQLLFLTIKIIKFKRQERKKLL